MMDRQALYIILLFLCGTVDGNSAVFNPCIQQIELSQDEAHQVLENWPETIIDRGYKCFLTCVLLDLGLITKSGDLQIDKYMKSGVVDWRWVATDLVVCRIEFSDEKDLCELSFGLFNCFRRVKKEAEEKLKKH
ncbi:general odorant-binding protein 57e [Drosophila biarmipes]|uniref:Odorant-binding protein 57e n=1 Tax=Drosophila biarmipes TaxID=125945 RepID=B0M2D9_DROBM|nr:general odorant-binding protein 57e [Drosophila biarmipes]BAG11617.1 odorant-binding protein 57e [Drosophila biarmipes]